MTRRSPLTRWGLVMSAVLVVAVLARAGPIRTVLPADIRSLGNLVHVRLRIAPMPEQVAALGVTASAIEKRWAGVLRRAGIVVVDEEGAVDRVPEVGLRIHEGTDPAFPDALALSGALTVKQWVTVDRLVQSMPLETYHDYLVGLEKRENVNSAIEDTTQQLIERFVKRTKRATGRGR